jgi:hypothetical protein
MKLMWPKISIWLKQNFETIRNIEIMYTFDGCIHFFVAANSLYVGWITQSTEPYSGVVQPQRYRHVNKIDILSYIIKSCTKPSYKCNVIKFSNVQEYFTIKIISGIEKNDHFVMEVKWFSTGKNI